MWTRDSQDTDEAREKELSNRFFKPALDEGAQMARHHNTTQSAHAIVRRIVKNHPVTLQIQRELVDERGGIIHTTAGEAINREFSEQTRRHQDELKRAQEDMMEALKEKDERTRKELEEESRRLWEWMGKFKKDVEEKIANYAAEKGRMEAQIVEMDQDARMERQWTEAQLANLDRRLQDATNASAADRAMLEQEVEEREQADAEHNQQLVDLTRRLQDEINASAAYRARLEQGAEKVLQDRVATVATMPPRASPRPTLYVQVFSSRPPRWLTSSNYRDSKGPSNLRSDILMIFWLR